MAKTNRRYWEERFNALEKVQYEKSIAYYQDVQKQFHRAEEVIIKDIEEWYARLAINNHIDLKTAKELLKKGELREFKWKVKQYIKYGKENGINKLWMKELENASAKMHITRLEGILFQIQCHARKLFNEYEIGVTNFLETSFTDNYYHTAYEIAKGIEIGTNLNKIDKRLINVIIKKPWATDKKIFSERIWRDREELIKHLQIELKQNIIQGKAPENAIRNLSREMQVGKAQARRIILTESAAITSKATEKCYEDLQIEKYEILATLDKKTSKTCRKLDKKVFNKKDYKVGDTAPPFHPNCRTTTIPFFFSDKFVEKEERIARTRNKDNYYIPANMKYEEWEERFVH